MDFRLSEEHLEFQKLFRDFAEKEVKPLAAEIDEQERFPDETIKKMKELGLLGIPVPEEEGGQGADYLSYILCVEELSRVCVSTAVILSAHIGLCIEPIRSFGTDNQKSRYVSALSRGELLGAFALTEPNAGSDASGILTRAALQGDNYILNGSKIFITNGGKADVYIIFAMTNPSAGTKGISAFIVEKDFPGFSVGKKEHKMGIRGSQTTELVFEDCIVPKENLLGKEGEGFKIAMASVGAGRIAVGAQSVGLSQGAFDEAVKYVKQRQQFGKPIAAFQNTQFVLAELRTKIEAARLLTYSAAMAKQNGEEYTSKASMVKLFCAQTAMEVTTKCLQLHGGYGYTREYPIERMMRDAKILEIYEGTSEVQKMIISGSFLR